MAIENTDKRKRLIQAAMSLAYRHGFRETSLADIASHAHVPLGNVYYYFKTKEEIGEAIVEERLAEMKSLQRKLGEIDHPEDRLCAFVQMTLNNRETLARRGCPIGTLCTELHKEGGALAKESSVLFTELLVWLTAQFDALHTEEDARGLAVHLLSALQGIAVISFSLNDPQFVVLEAGRLKTWIQSLGAKKSKRGTA
jgi:TetR/AcrR family transcriptional regulator, transcriptional repressor for nem operon